MLFSSSFFTHVLNCHTTAFIIAIYPENGKLFSKNTKNFRAHHSWSRKFLLSKNDLCFLGRLCGLVCFRAESERFCWSIISNSDVVMPISCRRCLRRSYRSERSSSSRFSMRYFAVRSPEPMIAATAATPTIIQNEGGMFKWIPGLRVLESVFFSALSEDVSGSVWARAKGSWLKEDSSSKRSH